jgi:hypothetical protein
VGRDGEATTRPDVSEPEWAFSETGEIFTTNTTEPEWGFHSRTPHRRELPTETMTKGVVRFESLVAQDHRRGPPRCLKVRRDNADHALAEFSSDVATSGSLIIRFRALTGAANRRRRL